MSDNVSGNVLVLNAGSSSLKVSLLDPADRLLLDRNQPVEDGDVPGALEAVLKELPAEVGAVGHRVVHGGADHVRPTRVDDDLRRSLEELVDLAPLHQPPALAGLEAAGRLLPGVPAVACFDTAFHATLPAAATTYPLPAAWRQVGVRRYGFHGLSHAYASRRAAGLVTGAGPDADPEAAAGLRVVTCHLGAGASLAAVRGGRSVDTTMGFTPLEGLMMARRSGSVDPGALLWLLRRHGLGADELDGALSHASGFVGLAGTADQAEVGRRAAAGDGDARLALEVYLHRLRAGVAAMAAALGGLDALVFTGGVGEHAPEVRAGCAAGLGFLGVVLDALANLTVGLDDEPDHELTGEGARVRSFVIRAREDLQIAREVRAALG